MVNSLHTNTQHLITCNCHNTENEYFGITQNKYEYKLANSGNSVP